MSKALEALGFIRRTGGDNSLCALWGLGPTAIDDQVDKGLLPKAISISPRLKGWPPAEIAAIRDARIAGKSEDEIKTLVAELEAKRKAKAA